MSLPPSGDALRAVPTLTEVLEWPPASALQAAAAAAPTFDEAALVQRVLAGMQPGWQRAADELIRQCVRDIVEPALERLADALAREVRDELAAALRDVAQRAVEEEVARQRVP